MNTSNKVVALRYDQEARASIQKFLRNAASKLGKVCPVLPTRPGPTCTGASPEHKGPQRDASATSIAPLIFFGGDQA